MLVSLPGSGGRGELVQKEARGIYGSHTICVSDIGLALGPFAKSLIAEQGVERE